MRRWSNFKTRVPAKWVLAGEHSVLRGATAIALPHPEMHLELSYESKSSGSFEVEPQTARSVIRELLESVSDESRESDRSFPMPEGLLKIESNIPIGAGLGSSAALSVAMTRWLSEPLLLNDRNSSGGVDVLFEFAKKLEHRFHGRSSGMDIAAVLANEPISFIMARGYQPLGVKKLPKFTFHDTGMRARTSDCVARVQMFNEDNPTQGMHIDEQMGLAARNAMEGLIFFDGGQSARGLERIAEGMRLAQDCFHSWGLIPTEARQLEEDLKSQGALATKLTGAGGGGMVVALWDKREAVPFG